MKGLLALSLLVAASPGMVVAQVPEPAAVHRSLQRAKQEQKPVDLRRLIPELSDTTRGRPWTAGRALKWAGVGSTIGFAAGAIAAGIELRTTNDDLVYAPAVIVGMGAATGAVGGAVLGFVSYAVTRAWSAPSPSSDPRDQSK
jgi:hypothetical protein